MHGNILAGYFRTSTEAEIFSLSFKDKNYAMVFVMPQSGQYFKFLVCLCCCTDCVTDLDLMERIDYL